jgi:hypothetical protein
LFEARNILRCHVRLLATADCPDAHLAITQTAESRTAVKAQTGTAGAVQRLRNVVCSGSLPI